jgi:hypothetical protein
VFDYLTSDDDVDRLGNYFRERFHVAETDIVSRRLHIDNLGFYHVNTDNVSVSVSNKRAVK